MSGILTAIAGLSYAGLTPLADQPVRTSSAVPANVMLALSVEWPTGNVQAYNDAGGVPCPGRDSNNDSVCYFATKTYLGYFDPFKCYTYNTGANYFVPAAYTSGASAASPTSGDHSCSNQWSGNYLNWATSQTTDTFRWAMTGGDRFIDTASLTVLEKARHDGQGGFNQFPLKRLGGNIVGAGASQVNPVLPSTVTPYTYAQLFTRTQGLNTVMWVSPVRDPIRNNNHPNGNNPLNTLDVPAATVQTYQEEGNCTGFVPPSAGVTCTVVSAATAGTRQVTEPVTSVDEPGQCDPSGSFVSCVNTTAPNVGTRQYQYDQVGFCPSVDANSTACLQGTPGRRKAQVTEPGTCATRPAAPSGTVFGTCTDIAPVATVTRAENGTCPVAGAISCTVVSAGTRTFRVRENGQCAVGLPPGAAGCTNTSGTTRRYQWTQAGQCPPPAAPPGAQYDQCNNGSTATRSVVRTENVTCPASGATACTQVSAEARRYDITEPGQCPWGAAPSGGSVGPCSNFANPVRRVTFETPGQCPGTAPASGGALVAGSCQNLVAANPLGTRTVVRNVSRSEAGQCANYTGTGTCSDTTAPQAVGIREIANATVTTQAFYIRVKVCDSAFPETQTNCSAYGTSLKPEGIIQENALKMRFGAFGYLLDGSQTRDGGVLRARMKDVGPDKTVPGNPPDANSNKEWNTADGTYVNNPDPTDTTNTGNGASNSGVINYLNKFGRLAGYKGFDPYSELYAEVVKYFKPRTSHNSTPEYSASLNNAVVDGFPVITNWNDPVQYACQKNFVVGIADANTHKDKNLNGNADRTNEPATTPSTIDGDYNVVDWTNRIGSIEGVANLANYRNCCNGSAYLAGLAYYAHVSDLRPDFDNVTGKQNLTSYFVDVREAGSWGMPTGPGLSGTGDPRNQLWLASKYGGFKDFNNNGQFDAADTWSTGTAEQGYPVPKNYFAASQPERLVNGLRDAFRDIAGEAGAGAGAGLSSTNVSQTNTGSGIYKVLFNPVDWTGNVQLFTVTQADSAGNLTLSTSPAWDSKVQLESQTADSRVIVTGVPGASQLGQPFRIASLSNAQKTALGSTATEQTNILNYLRGDKTLEEFTAAGNVNPGGIYRTRAAKLGDIVDSEAVYVQGARLDLGEGTNPGFAAYRTSVERTDPADAATGRAERVYVGANDGMLHAFDGGRDATTGGKEKWAYIPSFMFNGPTAPAVDGLRNLANPSFNHKFMVNATPLIREADLNRTMGAGGPSGTGTPDWRTLLIGGLGKGGRGYYALDVTNADSPNETTMASRVLWEFTDEDMGFSFGAPVLVRSPKWGWVVLLTSGYNNIYGSVAANRGKGFLYVLNAKTGALIQKVGTGIGSATDPSGLAQIDAYIPSLSEYIVDQVYGGDLLGNFWRFDLSSDSLDIPSPLLMAELRDSTGAVQPVTTAPYSAISVSDNKRYVFVGTGRYLDTADTSTRAPAEPVQNSFYAFRDGSRAKRFTATPTSTSLALPVGNSFPITRAQMVKNTDATLVTREGISPVDAAARPMGWFYDLPGLVTKTNTSVTPNTTDKSRERITINPEAGGGVVAWTSNLPETDTCNPDGKSYVYATSYGSGSSVLGAVNASGNLIRVVSRETTAAVKTQLVTYGSGSDQSLGIIMTDSKGNISAPAAGLNFVGAGRLINWREIIQQ
jgi:type IV pilus assembly protein PilY1